MMSNQIDLKTAAQLLRAHDDIMIFMHKNPDGDTLGSGYALLAALRRLGKRVNARCDSEISKRRYGFMITPVQEIDFEPRYYVAVDTAAPGLLGEKYKGINIDLCIDHHGSNSAYAQNLWCDPDSASCAEMIARLIDELDVAFDRHIAECLYTGLASDTGCFRYSNTTADSLRLGARLLDLGVDNGALNNSLFEVKTRARFDLEQMAIAGMEITCKGRVAIMTVTQDMMRRTGIDPADIEGFTAIPRNIEGVQAGVTLRELKNGNYKVSLRTIDIDASAIAQQFGGGGHKRASGFECSGSQFDIKVAVVAALKRYLT
jgi:phosphoesterase RecJ-like protein